MENDLFPTFWKVICDGLPWLLSTIIGGFITYRYERWRGQQTKKEDLTAICCSVAFMLALQCSELTRLRMELERRIALFKEINGENTQTPNPELRKKYVSALQDFDLNDTINIEIDNLGGIILPAGKECRGILESLQSIYISNSNYIANLNAIKNYHEFKHSTKNLTTVEIYEFAKNNFPSYLKCIASTFNFSKQALEAFRMEAENKLGIRINVTLGDIIKLP